MGKRKREMRDSLGEPPTGYIGCKYCKSTRGTFVRATNAFLCETAGCKGARHKTVTIEGEIKNG